MISTNSRNRPVTLIAISAIVIMILLVLVFLPPFRLLERIQRGGYTFLTSENPIASHEDGIQITAALDDLDGNFGVQFDSVPQLNFLEGSAGSELKRAAEALPANLVVKSPYYKIATRGEAPASTIVAVDIPNNAEPWETLDLYTWTGEGWEWVGSQLDTDHQLLLAEVNDQVPEAVVAVQAGATPPAILTELQTGQAPDVAASSGATHLLLLGLSLGDAGGIEGNLGDLPRPAPGDSVALIPSLRNWSEKEASPNQAQLADLLGQPEAQQAHINNIVALVIGQGYAGVDLDYRGVTADWRDSYSNLVAELAQALHAQGKVLLVSVDMPTLTADGTWETGGYDWRALGQTADVLRVPLGDASQASSLQQYQSWALSQVNRYKLFPTIYAQSSDRVGDQVNLLTLEQALASLSQVSGPEGDVVPPGEMVQFTLDGEALDTVQLDEGTSTYRYTYQDQDGNVHQVTVATAASLSKMLDWAMQYHLGGVFVSGLLEPSNDPAIPNVVQQFAARTPPTASNALQVIWTVQATAGEQLDRQDRPLIGDNGFQWTAPQEGGDYVVSAAVAAGGSTQGVNQGQVSISVATPTPPGTPTPTPTPTPDPNQPTATPVPADCLNSTYVADVTVPDHTRFEKGESFVKTWRVRNTGSCPWPEDAKLTFISGEALDAPDSVSVEAVEAGGTTDVSVDMVAPDSDGNFQGVWRLADGAGKAFGTRLTVVIKVGEEQQPAAPAPNVPAPGGGGGFELGGHIRTWNYVPQMKQAGMTWAKAQVHYGQDASGLVQAAHSNGLKIQLSALGGPNMVTQPNFHADYTAWVASLARAGADAIEVWNEPNIEREWQIGHISPEAYTQLLCASYSAIKEANPGTSVISAAPAPTGYFGGCSGNGCDDLPWLQGMYNAGAANCMDYIGAHHNAGATSPSASSGHPADGGGGHHSWYFLPQTQIYYNVFGGARKIFYTEMGYASQEGLPTFSDQFAWARGINNAQQAAWLAEAVNLSRSTGMVRCIIVWNIDFVRYGYDPQDGYAIIRPGGSCPACDALGAVMR